MATGSVSLPSSVGKAVSGDPLRFGVTGGAAIGIIVLVIVLATNMPVFTSSPGSMTPNPVPPQAGDESPYDLYVDSEDLADRSYLIKGGGISAYEVGDQLVVYEVVRSDTELAIALLRVTAKNPDSLSAEVVLENSTRKIFADFRVDDNVSDLSTSELVPVQPGAVGYLLKPDHVRLRPDSDVQPDMVLEAMEAQKIDGTTADYLPFDPPVKLNVVRIGPNGVIADVETILEDVKWPEAGTLIFAAPDSGTSIITPDPFFSLLSEGHIHLNGDRLNAAEKSFNDATIMDPESPEPLVGLALVAIERKNRGAGLTLIEKALALDGNHIYARAAKIRLLLLQGGERDVVTSFAAASRGISAELDEWLACLGEKELFDAVILTATDVGSACPMPKYEMVQ